MHIAPYLASFGFLTVLHSVRVIRIRRRERIGIGDAGNADLQRLVRVFGNFTEYVPMGLILLLSCELVQAPSWFLHLSGGALLLGRCMHAVGLAKGPDGIHPRTFGMMLTFFSLVLSSLGVLFFSVHPPA